MMGRRRRVARHDHRRTAHDRDGFRLSLKIRGRRMQNQCDDRMQHQREREGDEQYALSASHTSCGAQRPAARLIWLEVGAEEIVAFHRLTIDEFRGVGRLARRAQSGLVDRHIIRALIDLRADQISGRSDRHFDLHGGRPDPNVFRRLRIIRLHGVGNRRVGVRIRAGRLRRSGRRRRRDGRGGALTGRRAVFIAVRRGVIGVLRRAAALTRAALTGRR